MSEIEEKILSGENVREVLISDLTEMANVVGKKVMIEPIDFSFYFSTKDEVSHAIRAKVKWNRDHLAGGTDGYFELHGNYAWVQAKDGEKINNQNIDAARKFFKKYRVLFAAVWENVLDASDVQDYFRCLISFDALLKCFNLKIDLTGVKDLKSLERLVRKENLFNMND